MNVLKIRSIRTSINFGKDLMQPLPTNSRALFSKSVHCYEIAFPNDIAINSIALIIIIFSRNSFIEH